MFYSDLAEGCWCWQTFTILCMCNLLCQDCSWMQC